MSNSGNLSSHFAVKRIMTELKEMKKNPCEEFYAAPISGNIFEWHFTIKGPPDTSFEGGYFHGKLIIPTQYPFKPPDLILLTRNGRFEVNKKICLNVTSYHKELWKPGWGVRTILLAVIGFFPTISEGIGSINYPDNVRKKLAKESKNWKCECCKKSNREIMRAQRKLVKSIKNKKKKNNDKKDKKKKKKKKKKNSDKGLRKRKKSSRSSERRKRVVFVEEDETLSAKLLNVFITLVLLSLVYGVVRFGVNMLLIEVGLNLFAIETPYKLWDGPGLPSF